MKMMHIRITFTDPLLGTKAGNAEVFTDFIAARRQGGTPPDEEEAARRLEKEGDVENASTFFHRGTNGIPILWDYQLKGFFKDACGSLRRVPGSMSSAVKAYKQVIDGTIFVGPRQIPLEIPGGAATSFVERPLRAQTMKGERVALARSESAPAGTSLECEVLLLDPGAEPLVREWLDYGALRGIGQWRNSGMGRFAWEELA